MEDDAQKNDDGNDTAGTPSAASASKPAATITTKKGSFKGKKRRSKFKKNNIVKGAAGDRKNSQFNYVAAREDLNLPPNAKSTTIAHTIRPLL